MTLKAILPGSIGTVAETSDIQRRAYDQALAEAGVEWQWGPDNYRELLNEPGGKRRLARLSSAAGDILSGEQIDVIHERKTHIACAEVAGGVDLKPGIATLVQEAFDAGISVAFVTSTYRPNIDAAEAVTIEDSAASVSAANAAGFYTVATPGLFTTGQDFSAADRVLGSLEGESIAEIRRN